MPPPRKRHLPFAWRPVAIYVGIVILAGIGLILWDRSYEAARHSIAVPSPETAARNVVENVVGPGTVQRTTLDQRTGTLTMNVKDVVTDKGKTTAQNRELLSREGTQAAETILGLITFKHVTLNLVRDGKTVATVRAEPGKPAQTEFGPDLK